MADYKLWNALKNAKKYRWVELSHSLNNESPYWSGIPEGSVELAKTVWDWGKPELECLIQTFKFPGQFGTHIDFPGHFIKGKAPFMVCHWRTSRVGLIGWWLKWTISQSSSLIIG